MLQAVFMNEDRIIGTMKDARKLLPHRSNSVIQDWISKKNVSVTSSGSGTGHAFGFTKHQFWDLMVIDQFSALGMLSKPYDGPNYRDDKPGKGHIREVFEFPDEEDIDPNDVFPPQRSREHALAYYRKFGSKILIRIALMRRKTLSVASVKHSTKKRSKEKRSKLGMLYYNVTYIPEKKDLYEKVPRPEHPYPILDEIAEYWRKGTIAGMGSCICLISLDLLAEHVSLTLGLLPEE